MAGAVVAAAVGAACAMASLRFAIALRPAAAPTVMTDGVAAAIKEVSVGDDGFAHPAITLKQPQRIFEETNREGSRRIECLVVSGFRTGQ
jgi:uncharacterized cupredoxin-like copper-binding protein